MDLASFLAQQHLMAGQRLIPYVLRQTNPATGGIIPQTAPPVAPPPPPTVGAINPTAIQSASLSTGVWTPYVPFFGSSAGAITAGSATGRWRRDGKTFFVSFSVTITTNGTGSGVLLVGLPLAGQPGATTAVVESYLFGRETGVTGNPVLGVINGSYVSCIFLSGAYPGSSGATIHQSGVLEVT